jgi:uncharacterized integral membrane protein (TIGR00698 family)
MSTETIAPTPRRFSPGRHAAAAGRRTRLVVPGLALTALVGLVAHLAASSAFPFALAIGFEVPLAMLLGMVVINIAGARAWAMPGVAFSVNHILRLGIILLGLRLNLQTIAIIGGNAIALVAVTMSAALVFAVVVGRRLGVSGRVAVMIGVGTSVCGNSAIVAAAPVLRADERETSFAVATITIFGTLAVFLFPLVGHALDLDALTQGLWAGTAVPDTAQTIAAAAAYSTVGRDVATVVKLVRNVLMAPLLLLIAWGWGRYGDDVGVSARAARRGALKAFPLFLLGFLALAAIRTARLVDPEAVAKIDVVTRACFVMALAALGMQTRLGQLRALGIRPFLLGLATALLLAGGSLGAIVALGLQPARTTVVGGSDPRPQGAWTTVCAKGPPAACGRAATPVGQGPPPVGEAAAIGPRRLTARVLATGIPGAGALSPVGSFLPGGPIHDKRGFAKATGADKVLDPKRLLVAGTSNFGAPLARGDWAQGSLLSLATDADSPLSLPAAFAAPRSGSGAQPSALGGAARLYTAQSPAFANRRTDSGPVTAGMPAVSNPLGISVNDAFGRPWVANTPTVGGAGTESVLDPDGRPLANPPSERAGGVFAGALTNRDPQRRPGSLPAGVVANALLGPSPDASGRAVFAVATTDGALAQVHVKDGVDGLAPAGTLAPLARRAPDPTGRAEPPARIGMLFNWVPDRFLYVTDPGHDAILQLHLDDDFHTFRIAATRRLQSPWFAAPVDLAPAVPEVANPTFSSNTTLAGGADMYVANRGSGAIVRLTQSGRVVAVAQITVPGYGVVGPGLMNGIAVSPDAGTIWVSLSGAAHRALSGSVVSVPAFGAPG